MAEPFLNPEGEKVKLFPLRAEFTVVIFLANDCPISNRYAPVIQALEKRFKTNGVAFWLAHPGADESPEAIRKHAREYGLTAPILLDPQHRLAKLAGAKVTPEAAVFRRDGSLAYHGRIDDRFPALGRERVQVQDKTLENALELLLAGKAVPTPHVPGVGCYIE